MLQASGASEQSCPVAFLGAANRADLRAVTRSSTRTWSRSPVPGWSLRAPLLSRELSKCHWPLFHSLQQQTSFAEGQHPWLHERATQKPMETRKSFTPTDSIIRIGSSLAIASMTKITSGWSSGHRNKPQPQQSFCLKWLFMTVEKLTK